MEKKEYYKHILPHFQQPGQAYFVTWNLKDAIPAKALPNYTRKLEELKNQIKFQQEQHADKDTVNRLRKIYRETQKKYIYTYNRLLDRKTRLSINLTQPEILFILKEVLHFWEHKKINNYAYCVMPNHVHWVFQVLERDKDNEPVYLQDILYSVKRFSARRINQVLNRTGTLWQEESYDTTIRDEVHLYRVIEYTLNNPVKAGLVDDWTNWEGAWCVEE